MKLSKKLLSILLCAVMVLGSAAVGEGGFTEMLDTFSVTANAKDASADKFQTPANAAAANEDPFFDGIIGFFRRIFFSTITYDTDGGSKIDSFTGFKFFKKVVPPADPVKEGYTFDGWDTEIPQRTPWKNKTIKAKWIINNYRIDWEVDGKIVYSENHDYSDVILMFNPEQKQGYTFSGWDEVVPETMPAKNLKFVGEYIANIDTILTIRVYRMDFNGNYNYHQDKIVRATTDKEYTYEPKELEGFTLDTDRNNLTTIVNADNSSEINVYYIRNKYTVTFSLDNGIDENIENDFYYGTKINEPLNPQRGGHEFVEWSPKVPEVVMKSETYTAQWKIVTKVVEATESSDFIKETSALVNETLSAENFDRDKALEDEYYTARLITQSKDLSKLNIDDLNAEKVIMNDENMAVLQFSSKALTVRGMEILENDENIVYVEPDSFDEYTCADYIIENIETEPGKTWGEPFMSEDTYANYLECNRNFDMVTVAVIDTGVDMDHPFLKNRVLSTGYDYVENDNDPEDENGHGTHVAGTIVDCTNNLNVKIMPIRVLDENGSGCTLSVVNGITWAMNNGAKVINMSLGMPGHKSSIDQRIEKALEKNIVCVVAAGNDAADTANTCPAHMDGAIVVGAIDEEIKKCDFSNYGESVDLVAPGYKIHSSYSKGRYAIASGTSQAAPHVSAAVAMLLLKNPDFTPAQMEQFIKENCISISSEDTKNYYGAGYFNMNDLIPVQKISFETNGGTKLSSVNVQNGSLLQMPESSKKFTVIANPNGGTISKNNYSKNCVLEGWYEDSGFAGARYIIGEKYLVLKDVTLYSKWTNPKLYDFTIPDPTREGFSFAGWFSSANGGDERKSFYSVNGDTTIYAHWTVNSYQVAWSDGKGCTITVKRVSSPNAGAATGTLNKFATVYYGDVLSVSYAASTGYSLTSSGNTSITVTGNVDGSKIYASATPNKYTYNIEYKSINGTLLGKSSVTNEFGTTRTVEPANYTSRGYTSPVSQSVVWDSTSPKTITFTYQVQNITRSPLTYNMGIDSNNANAYISISDVIETRNRTQNSVQIRVKTVLSISSVAWDDYAQILIFTPAGTSGTKKQIVPYKTWPIGSTGSIRSSSEVATDWVTVSLGTTDKTTVSATLRHYQANSNSTDMTYSYGTSQWYPSITIDIPAY